MPVVKATQHSTFRPSVRLAGGRTTHRRTADDDNGKVSRYDRIRRPSLIGRDPRPRAGCGRPSVPPNATISGPSRSIRTSRMAVRSLAISGTGVAKRPVLATSLAYVRSASRRRTDSSMRLLTWPCQIVAPATSDGGRRSDNELSTSAEGQVGT